MQVHFQAQINSIAWLHVPLCVMQCNCTEPKSYEGMQNYWLKMQKKNKQIPTVVLKAYVKQWETPIATKRPFLM